MMSIQSLQQTAAANLVLKSSLSLSAAATADCIGRAVTRRGMAYLARRRWRMEQPNTFSPNYAAAKRRFLQAAKGVGAVLSSFPIQARVIHSEELTLHVAFLGASEPARS